MMRALVLGELAVLWRERGSVVLALALVGLLTLFSVLAASAHISIYLFIALVVVPLFVTAVAAVVVSSDRSTGYAAVLHTAPVTPSAYYASKLVAALFWAFLAVGLTIPLLLLLALHGGPALLGEVLPYLGTGALLAVFAATLGLAISSAVGKRGMLGSAFAGLAAAFGFTFTPLFLSFLPRTFQDLGERLARLSPVVAMYVGGPPAPRDLGSAAGLQGVLFVAFFAAVFGVAGYVAYTRLQNPDGWDAPRSRILALGVGTLVVMALPLAFTEPPDDPLPRRGFEGRGSERIGGAEVAILPLGAESPQPDQEFQLALGQSVRATVFVRLGFAGQEPDLTLRDVRLRFTSFQDGGARVRVEPAELALGDIGLEPCPGVPDPRCRQYPPRSAEVTLTLERTPVLLGTPVALQVDVTTDQGNLTTFIGNLRSAPSGYQPWQSFVVGGLVMAAVALPHVARARTLGRKTPAAPVALPSNPPKASFQRLR